MIKSKEFRSWLLGEFGVNSTVNAELIRILKMPVKVLQQYLDIIWMEIMDGDCHEVDTLTMMINEFMYKAA